MGHKSEKWQWRHILPTWRRRQCLETGELGIPNLGQMSLIKRYWMVRNAKAKVAAFIISQLLRENQGDMD